MDEENQAPPAAPGGDGAFSHYVSLLSDEDPSRRWKAAEGLARLGDPRAVIPLRRAMANPVENDRVKEIIGEAVREIGMKGMG